MLTSSLQASIEVTAGTNPGVPLAAYRRRWVVRGEPDAHAVEDRLRDRATEAMHYAWQQLPFPQTLRWMQTTVVWTGDGPTDTEP